jgi:hypothetical protein
MTDKKVVHILIFSFAVLMVLLRPYAAYQISKHADLASDPVKTNNFFQRLIKKRDEHHTVEASKFTVVQQLKIALATPVTLISFSRKPFALSLTGLKQYCRCNTVFHICPQNNYYRKISKFQI